ncbi:MAG: beta-galactosidase [Bacteroidetes bacterium]|nr:beta-galactosidase [Bacteroidota bacterium]
MPLFLQPAAHTPVKDPSVLHAEIKKTDKNYQLYVNGAPYYIKGAGGYSHLEDLKQCGGNSLRLWSTIGAKKYLDKAQELGLTVTLGLDMELERRGFNYSDKKAVAAQFERIKKEVLAFKDHPALLMWGVGNELDQFANNYDVWNAVNDVVKFIHQVDPNHPTTTMLAGVPKKHVKEIMKRCPSLDVLSINAFLDVPNVRAHLRDAGWNGPYMVGEWGASGYWEALLTPWGAFIEETSTQKANLFEEHYQKAMVANTDRCIGSYVFYWGYKQARTHTLLSLYLESGENTGMIDAMQKNWTGKERANRAPLILPIGIDDKKTHEGVYLQPGSQHMAYTDCNDPDNDPLYYFWEVYHESTEKKEGGDKEDKPAPVSGVIIDGKGKALTFKAPDKPGAYRLYVTVYDGKNNVATANAPFYVK